MKDIFVCLILVVSVVYCSKTKCGVCKKHRLKEEVCGTDGKTYESFCKLKRASCLEGTDIGFECDGKCPCDPIEVVSMDPGTVHKLKSMRTKNQLDEHIKREFYENEGVVVNEKVQGNLFNEFPTKTNEIKAEDKVCQNEELSQLPSRLIDWFHVLKTNEKEEELRESGEKNPKALKELEFVQAKLNSMYSMLACQPQKDDKMEEQVCLLPVKWMFKHMDQNNDKALSADELKEIEQLESEHCIKPFLQRCDSDQNGLVTLKEFCKCLCFTPPCTRVMQTVPVILLRGEPRPVPGFFIPRCDEDGFYMPVQCNDVTKECWCVNRNGGEYAGTRKSSNAKLDCDSNTHLQPNDDVELIPLDVAKENTH